MDDECPAPGATSLTHCGGEVTAAAHSVSGWKHPYGRDSAIRRRARCDPCGAEPTGSPGRRGCASVAGSHASWRGADCSAGTSAWSREDSRVRNAGRWVVIVRLAATTGCADLHRTPTLLRGHAKRGRRQALPRYG